MSNPSDDRPEQTGTGENAAPREPRVEPVAAPAVEDPAPAAPAVEDPAPAAPAVEDPAPAAPIDVDDRPALGEEAEEPTVEDFNDQISNCDDDLEAIDRQISELQRQRSQIEGEKDQLIVERDRLFPRPNAAQAVRAYLDQQQKNREARAGKLAQLQELGIISGKAPIDAVRARGTGHGRRPVQYPVVLPK